MEPFFVCERYTHMDKSIKWIGTIVFALTMFACVFASYKDYKRLSSIEFVYDIDMRIAQINYESKLTDDKFQKPQLCNVILFETIEGEKLYREINTCSRDFGSFEKINNEWIYNHQVGDTVHFDYLRADRFFKINK